MFDRIEQLMDKILPDLARGTKRREEETQRVVSDANDARQSSEDAIFEAYRKAGLAYSHLHSNRGRRR